MSQRERERGCGEYTAADIKSIHRSSSNVVQLLPTQRQSFVLLYYH